jgi:hypothetical protein
MEEQETKELSDDRQVELCDTKGDGDEIQRYPVLLWVGVRDCGVIGGAQQQIVCQVRTVNIRNSVTISRSAASR